MLKNVPGLENRRPYAFSLIVLFPASWLHGGCPANPGDSFFNLLHSRSHENAKSAHLHDSSEVKARSNRTEDPDRIDKADQFSLRYKHSVASITSASRWFSSPIDSTILQLKTKRVSWRKSVCCCCYTISIKCKVLWDSLCLLEKRNR